MHYSKPKMPAKSKLWELIERQKHINESQAELKQIARSIKRSKYSHRYNYTQNKYMVDTKSSHHKRRKIPSDQSPSSYQPIKTIPIGFTSHYETLKQKRDESKPNPKPKPKPIKKQQHCSNSNNQNRQFISASITPTPKQNNSKKTSRRTSTSNSDIMTNTQSTKNTHTTNTTKESSSNSKVIKRHITIPKPFQFKVLTRIKTEQNKQEKSNIKIPPKKIIKVKMPKVMQTKIEKEEEIDYENLTIDAILEKDVKTFSPTNLMSNNTVGGSNNSR